MNKGKTIFAQIMSLFNEYDFKKCVDRYKGDRHAIKFSCRDQFMVVSFAQFTDRAGLRDIETTLDLCGDLYRSELKVMPRSTLEEDNEKKEWRIYQDFAMTLVKEATELYKYFQMKGAYFVTRAKDNMSYEVIESRPVNRPVTLTNFPGCLPQYYLESTLVSLNQEKNWKNFPEI